MSHLPLPSTEAIAHSQRLISHLCAEIQQAGGVLPFSRYMEAVLYAPGLGYYSAGSHKIGQAGDFITAPEISPLFAACLAQQCAEVLSHLPKGDILELGAGTGKLAADLLLHLESRDALPQHYYILDISSDLKARQQQWIRQRCPHLASKVKWLSALPRTMQGIIVGNEVLDALPISRFQVRQGRAVELGVGVHEQGFGWTELAATPLAMQNLVDEYALTDGYTSELNLTLPAFITSLSRCLSQGIMLWIDYGYARKTYYAPERHQGTLRCYYRHHAHENPFVYPGLQDITSHVDFSLVADSALEADMHVLGYTTQAAFLIANGLESALSSAQSLTPELTHALMQQAKTLVSPTQMGENFKVMTLGKHWDLPLASASLLDLRSTL